MAGAAGYLQYVDQYQHFLVMEKGLSEKTVAAYSADLQRFGRFLENKHACRRPDCTCQMY